MTLQEERRQPLQAAPPSSITSAYALLGRRPMATWVGALAGTLLIGVVDWATLDELVFSPFYLLPVSLVAWTSSLSRTVATAVVAALTWLAADVAAGADYSHPAIPIWNTSARLAVFLLFGGLIGQLRLSAQHEQELARTDPLTGVSNSRWFLEQTAAQLRQPDGCTLTLAYLDLDDFKAINDTRGHSGGDDVLAAVGTALRTSTRQAQDVVGRLGGDEFALLLALPEELDSAAHVAGVIQRVQGSLASRDVQVSFSAGAVSFLTAPATVDEAIDAADALMYEVKRAGKGSFRHRVAGPS